MNKFSIGQRVSVTGFVKELDSSKLYKLYQEEGRISEGDKTLILEWKEYEVVEFSEIPNEKYIVHKNNVTVLEECS